MLGARVCSALFLAPVVLLAVWFGDIAFSSVVALASALMIWEWDRMCRGRFGGCGMLAAGTTFVSALLAPHSPFISLGLVWVGTLVVAAFSRSGWLAMGVLYIGLPCLALSWLRGETDVWTLMWLLFVVWATDTGAYVFGRSIGGPKLAPRISPNKTWAGLLGGAVCAALTGAALPFMLDMPGWLLALVLAALLAVVAQVGDLFESSVKRRFRVKDSSGIIPGHGGILDRLDGLVAAAPVVVLVVLALGGGLGSW
ncbi:phosphatidate cytidylyltransferase [Haematospirillum jordaniae]|uniref:phosphatidate cytidylyltransferase n=1 Tax=Haematospirillum jordaniae TaxID=1549855 RepID=UPI001432EC12|nr:phosphatidate cytidylyltransferase [Haematospirillum jordaniae]NKD84749.1 phosphatidate cytidylyltransferase [Haematospirillum jordaniae]